MITRMVMDCRVPGVMDFVGDGLVFENQGVGDEAVMAID